MDQETFALRDVLRIFRQHRWQILGFVAVALVAALAISFAQPKRYTAEAQLVVGPAVPSAALPEAPGGSDAGPLGLDLPAETQARIVSSPKMTLRVARSLKLSPDPAEIKELTKRVQVKAVTDNLLLITVNAPTAVEAAALANGYAKEYLDSRHEVASDALAALSSDYQGRAQRTALQARQLQQLIDQASARGASEDVARLTNQRNDLRDQSGTLSRQARSVASRQAAEYPTGEIIAPAVPPPASSSPQPVRNALIAMILGGAAGASFALLREHVNDRVRTRDEAARAANAPVLAALPKGSVPSTAKTQAVTLSAPEAMASEAYRQLHRNLVRRGLGGRVRRLLVTSVEPRSETSETVANLAVLCARTGQAAMAISANLRHSRLHTYFGISDEHPGLATALADAEMDSDDIALSALSMALGVTPRNLLVLPSGTASVSPGEVFNSAGLHHIFSLAAEMAQVLIIEAPPILSSDDALTLTAHADAVLLVLRAGVDKEGVTARAAAILETTGAVLLGTVLHNAQKDDETVGWFERYQIEQEHLPAPASRPPDAEWDHARLGNGQRSTKVPVGDSSHEESTRHELGDHRPDGA